MSTYFAMNSYSLVTIGSILLLSCVSAELQAQQDTIQLLLDRVLFNRKVFPKVFFSYAGVGEYPHVLAPGTYSYIYPDSAFKEFYPDIIRDLSVTWGNERKVYTKTYLKHPGTGTVFIKSNVNSDPNLKYYLTFSSINIEGSKANVKFFTSCNCIDYQNGRMMFFEAILDKRRDSWKVKKVKISRKEGCR
jgi:hypothetical protein